MNTLRTTPENTPSLCQVRILPHDRMMSVPENTRLSDVIREFLAKPDLPAYDLLWQTACAGRGTCEKCSVILYPPETQQNVGGGDACLACQTYVCRDMTVLLPCRETDLSDGGGDAKTHAENDAAGHILTWARRPSWEQDEEGEEVTSGYAVAIDLGTTTLVLSLLKDGKVLQTVASKNPQREYGHDVISRIKHVMEHPEDMGMIAARGLRFDLMLHLHMLLLDACRKAERGGEGPVVRPGDISEIVLAGNTVMEEFFLGTDVTTLGTYPFLPSASLRWELLADDPLLRGWLVEKWGMRPETKVRIFPVISGFVGGDLTAGIAVSKLLKQKKPTLFVDIGTNGEMVLFVPEKIENTQNTGRLLACATAAGPAFEGAQITHGMTARPGAVDHVSFRHNPETRKLTVEMSVIGGTHPHGICGSGLIDATAELLRHNILTTTGKLHTPNGKFFLAADLYLTQFDLRQVQLAVGAISTGMRILLKRCGLTAGDLGGLWIAGGFGRFLDLKNAQRIGLLPRELPLENVRFLGNTALLGAETAARWPGFWRKTLRIPTVAEAIDLAQDENFSDYFMESMNFPEEE